MRRLFGVALLSLAVHVPAQTLQLSPSELLSRAGAKPALAGNAEPTPTAAPIRQGYLYIETYQTRFEALFDTSTMLSWLQPDQAGLNTLAPDAQQTLIKRAEAQAAGWCRLFANGQQVPVRFSGASIVKGAPGRTLPMEADETVPVGQAMIGFTWEMPTPPSPDVIEVEWSGFRPDFDRLPIRVFFGPLSETLELTPGLPKAKWQNKGRLARPAALAAVPAITTPPPFRLPLAATVWFVGGLVFYIVIKIRGYRLPGGSLPYLGVWLVVALLMSPLLVVSIPRSGGSPKITAAAQAEAVISPLLRNVYRAFDHRNESDIYDVLARSVDGPLLRQLYLETIQALTLEGREGTRVTISEFDATVMDVEPDATRRGFVASCQWTALGSVGHWGHTHQRVNRYTAKLTVSAIQSEWKITALEVSEARRL